MKRFLQAGIDPGQEACTLARDCRALLAEVRKILSACLLNMEAGARNEDYPSILAETFAMYSGGLGTALQATSSSGHSCNSGSSLARSAQIVRVLLEKLQTVDIIAFCNLIFLEA